MVGFPAGIPRIPLNLTLLKGCHIVGVFWGEWIMRNRDEFARSAEDLMRMYAAGQIKPKVSRVFPLEQSREALRTLPDRRALGKIVVTMTP